jgi:hypothetical protein
MRVMSGRFYGGVETLLVTSRDAAPCPLRWNRNLLFALTGGSVKNWPIPVRRFICSEKFARGIRSRCCAPVGGSANR